MFCTNVLHHITKQHFAKRFKANANDETKGYVLVDNAGETIGHRRKQLRQKFFGHEGTTNREQHVSIYIALSAI